MCCSLGGRQALFSGFAPGAVHMGVGQTRMTEWGADVMMNQKLGRFACPPFLAKRGSHQDSPIPHSAAVPPPSLGHLVPTPSAIGLFNSKLPPGPPKKGGRTWPNYQGQRLLFAILGPWCHIAASHGESLDGRCAGQEALAADARMALRGPAAVTAQVGINQGSHLHLRSLPRSSLAKMTYLLFGEERWQKIQRFLQPEHLLL